MRIPMIVLLLVLAAVPAVAGMTVTEMAVTTKIVKGNPVDSVHRISSSSVPALFCFTRINRDEEGETKIRHIWYREDVKEGESELPVKRAKWRTYSRRPIDRSSVGNWRVEALDESGKVVGTVRFRIN